MIALALVALAVFSTHALAAGSLIGKWQMGNAETEAMLQIEFSAGGVVMFRDQVGSYSTAGSNITIDGWNGMEVTMTYRVEGNTLHLTDQKGETLTFQRIKY
jgi:hypothetical protein